MNVRAKINLASRVCSVTARLAQIDWPDVTKQLDDQGVAYLPELLTPQECAEVASLYSNESAVSQPHRHGGARLWQGRI